MGNSIKTIAKFLGLIFMTGAFTYGTVDTINRIFEIFDE